MMLAENMTFWEAQKKEKQRIQSTWDKYSKAQDDALLLREKHEIEREAARKRKQRGDNIAYNEQLKKQMHFARADFNFVRQQGDHVKQHILALKEEDRQDFLRQEQTKADLRKVSDKSTGIILFQESTF